MGNHTGSFNIPSHYNGGTMLTKRLSLLAILLTFIAAPAFSEPAVTDEVKVNITSPVDGSTIEAGGKNRIQYEVAGPDVFHGRLEIDGKETKLLRKRIGTYKLPKLAAGVHELCLMALNKSHQPIGAASCINVTAQ